MPRKHFEWKFRDKTLQLGDRTLIVGVLNLTPDSFSDGGQYDDPDRAFAHALALEEQGADIIDIGAESTRPGSARISEAEELRRLIPVLKRLKNKLTIPLSIDTYKSGVAQKALEWGADIINDPSGLTFDPEITKAVLQYDAGLIINHMRGTPETWAKLPPLKNPLATIAPELDAAAHRATRGGVERRRIVIDPGLGFGKRKEQNSEILARLEELASLEYPILVGPSRKHFLAKESLADTEFATAGAVAAAILNGTHLVRVHDVKAMKSVAEVADEIVRARKQSVIETTGVVREHFSAQVPRPEAEPVRTGGKPTRPPLSRPAIDPAALSQPAMDQVTINEPAIDLPFIDHTASLPIADRPAAVRTPVHQPPAERSTRDYPPSTPRPMDRAAASGRPPASKSFSKPAFSKSSFSKPGISKPGFSKPGVSKPNASKSDSGRPSSGRSNFGRPSSGRPNDGRTDSAGPSSGRVSSGRPSSGRPSSGRPSSGRPSSGRPSSGRPSFGRPGTGRPGFGKSSAKPYDKRAGKRDDKPERPKSS